MAEIISKNFLLKNQPLKNPKWMGIYIYIFSKNFWRKFFKQRSWEKNKTNCFVWFEFCNTECPILNVTIKTIIVLVTHEGENWVTKCLPFLYIYFGLWIKSWEKSRRGRTFVQFWGFSIHTRGYIFKPPFFVQMEFHILTEKNVNPIWYACYKLPQDF